MYRVQVCARHSIGPVLCMALAGVAAAMPSVPTYTATYSDAVTGTNGAFDPDGKYRYTVNPGADSYQQDVYERPTGQSYTLIGNRYGGEEYFGYLDLTSARLGVDGEFIYASLTMYSRERVTNEGVRHPQGLEEQYAVRLGTNADGRGSVIILADNPEFKNQPNTTWGLLGARAHLDSDLDVGGRALIDSNGPSGRTVTKSDNPAEEWGMTGYETSLIYDGRDPAGIPAMWMRISPTDNRTVELAVRWASLGFTQADLANLTFVNFEAGKGIAGNLGSYNWNDKYRGIEAGSPNRGIGTDNEFGTQGIGGIAEIDTLLVSFVGTPPCVADTNRDGGVTIDDLLAYLTFFTNGSIEADVDNGLSTGTPDGGVTIDDLVYFLSRFEAGC